MDLQPFFKQMPVYAPLGKSDRKCALNPKNMRCADKEAVLLSHNFERNTDLGNLWSHVHVVFTF